MECCQSFRIELKRMINIQDSRKVLDDFKLVLLERFWVRFVSYVCVDKELFFSKEVLEGGSSKVVPILFTFCQLLSEEQQNIK